jgi:hypothetical protein
MHGAVGHGLPLLTLVLWSRIWLGWWTLVLVALVLLWTWWNPRTFSEPASLDNWMSQGVLGERVWLNRKNIPISKHFERVASILSFVSLFGLLPYIWGLVQLEIWPTILSLTMTMGAKLWFIDRMVWLFADMQDQNAEYR